jgi:hypothetical protein
LMTSVEEQSDSLSDLIGVLCVLVAHVNPCWFYSTGRLYIDLRLF